MTEFMILVHEFLCIALFYSCFCRATKTSRAHTRVEIRLAIWLLGVAASMGIVWPIYRNWKPDEFSIFLLFAVTVGQAVFSNLWSKGVPPAYKREPASDHP
jgi:hypothetical protein